MSTESTIPAANIGQVLGLALRAGGGAPMREVQEAVAEEGLGLRGDQPASPDRGITLIASRSWQDALRELGADLPWHTRRANVLIEAGSLRDLIGQRIRIGGVVVDVRGETRPCGLMDELHAGLKDALKPDCRGGVHGRIVRGGVIRMGDPVRVEPE